MHYVRGISMSPRKMRVVANLVRGKNVEEAVGLLDLMPKKAAGIISKAIKSAAANAEDKSRWRCVGREPAHPHDRRRRRHHREALDAALDGSRQPHQSPHVSHLTVVVTDEKGRAAMGQKTHPIGFRLGIIKTWSSRWYEEKNYAKWLHEDLKLKGFIKKKLHHAGVSYIEIERAANKAKINIHTARPGIVIGKRGAGVETLKKEVQALTENEVFLNIIEVRKAETNAQLVAENIATQLERRIAFRRAMKKATQTAMKFGAKGIKVASSGRLGGAEMCRREWYKEGRVPLHTLRADIEYGFTEAHTTYGSIGVKAWVFHGEVLPTARKTDPAGLRAR